MSYPLVSVNLCVYNCGPYLRETLDSILAQDYPNWELIMVDDGSTDDSYSIMLEYSAKQDNITVLQNPGNQGLTPSRNRCLSHSKGKYIAIHDGDDISRSDRLSKQVAFFEADTDEAYVLCGSWAEFFGEGLPNQLYMNPVEYVREFMLYNTSFVMTSLMIRRSYMDANHIRFDETISIGEDYDFEFRMLNHARPFRKGYNLPLPLVRYRQRNNSMSRGEHHEKTVVFSRNMRLKHFSLLYGRELTSQERDVIEEMFLEKLYHTPPTLEDIGRYQAFARECIRANQHTRYFDATGIQQFFAVMVLRLFFNQKTIGPKAVSWVLRAGIIKPYIDQFSIRDLLFMIKQRLFR